MNQFARPERKLLLEFLDADYRELSPTEGTFVMPGRAIEFMWFSLHCARRRNDAAAIRRAAETIRWHLEAGCDREYGGLFLGIDADGDRPFLPNSCLEWYERVHE
ncbi:MAG: AGE family epimerase/isomerase [Acidobacteriota bacterium]|nr:AGE family epimerase/isomerase [Acidobacteriota bacterium]